MFLLTGGLIVVFGQSIVADQAKEEAIKMDRAKYQGTWTVVSLEIDGKKVADKHVNKITVTNHTDGTWVIQVDGKEVSRGASKIDPTRKPKTIDFMQTGGTEKARTSFGIYEINGQTRKLCFAPPGKERPTEFSARKGSRHFLVVFQRESK
jgi:uncharacterized protein (TIGR03067 family)